MKDNDYDYELLDQNQQDADIRVKLNSLYSSPLSDILWFELFDPSLLNTGYHKLYYYEHTLLKHIILFRNDAKRKILQVILQEYKISLTQIKNICSILFHEFDKVQQVIFEKIFIPNHSKLPKITFEKTSNDVIINLPESFNAYINSLGKSTREGVRINMKRIARDFVDFKFHYLEKSDILFEHINNVVLLHRNRILATDVDERVCNIVHQYDSTSGFGFLCVCTIDDKIIGGTINSIIGEHAYSHVVGHSESYNYYSLGQLVLINTIQYLIEEKNIKYYHLSWGKQDYKFRLGGIDHELYTLRVFRNSGGKMMNDIKQRVKDNKTLYNLYLNFKNN